MGELQEKTRSVRSVRSVARMCVGCRVMKPKQELLRAVRKPDGEVGLDTTGKVNGRGAYVCRNPECFKRAVKTRAFERAFKEKLLPDVMEKIESEISNG